jgi:hypothetical protein
MATIRVEFRVPETVASALAVAAKHDLVSAADIARQALLHDLRARGLMTPTTDGAAGQR